MAKMNTYTCKFPDSPGSWHKVRAKTEQAARKKFTKGTTYRPSQVRCNLLTKKARGERNYAVKYYSSKSAADSVRRSLIRNRKTLNVGNIKVEHRIVAHKSAYVVVATNKQALDVARNTLRR